MMLGHPHFPRSWQWPDGQKICLNITITLEAFERASQVSIIGKPGQVDRFSLSYGDYAWKAGIWRLLRLLDDYGIKATMGTNGLFAERHRDLVRMLADEGHEICAHDWANDLHGADRSREEEAAAISRSTEILAEVTGVRPVGWGSLAASGTTFTNELLAEQGYRWCADDASDDLPFIEQTPNGPLMMMPRITTMTNDISAVVLSRNPTSVFVENFRDMFDESYREAELGCPRMVGMTLHAHMAGRLPILPMVRRCVDYARQHEGVYTATNADIAEWAFTYLNK